MRRELFLNAFGRSFIEQSKRYRQWLYSVKGKEKDFLDELRHGYVLGTDEFVDWVRRKFGAGDGVERPVKKRVRDERVAERVLKAVAQEYEVGTKELRRIRRRGPAAEPRQVAMYVLWSEAELGARKVGEQFEVTATAVTKAGGRVRAAMTANRALRQRVGRITRIALYES